MIDKKDLPTTFGEYLMWWIFMPIWLPMLMIWLICAKTKEVLAVLGILIGLVCIVGFIGFLWTVHWSLVGILGIIIACLFLKD
jgi:hypothetical protein